MATATHTAEFDLTVEKSGSGVWYFQPLTADSPQLDKFVIEAVDLVEPPKPPVNPFEDITEEDFFYLPVLWAVDHEITSGWTDTTFEPYMTCTRGQVVTFLWRANGCPEAEGETEFTDVSAGAYCAGAVSWAVEKGITDGWAAELFALDMECTRGQSVTFLYRAETK
ncbi:MAG: S-layer homology domain-containing protein [Lachnospiraceae bacterium]